MKIVGGLVLNRSVGGINPEAVERFGQMGGRMLWFPTMDARSFQQYKKKMSQVPSHFLTASGADGKLSAETVRVLETAARYQLTLGTGHLNADEGLALLREGKRLGIERMMVTHVEHPALNYSIEQQREAAAMGAMIEHSFNNVFFPAQHDRRNSTANPCRRLRACDTDKRSRADGCALQRRGNASICRSSFKTGDYRAGAGGNDEAEPGKTDNPAVESYAASAE